MKMKDFDIEYNSGREDLIIPEYGRNVQKLIDHAKTISDKEERQEFVEAVINLMNIMVPSNKSLEDNKKKMWNHVFKIARYDLDVDVPDQIEIHRIGQEKEPHDLKYPRATYKFRHYGSYVQKMITKARAMDDAEKKEGYSEAIASYMKLAYQTWNREHYVNDNVIKQDLEEISSGELTFKDDYSIENLVSIKQLKGSNNSKSTNNNRNKKFKKSNNNNNNRNKSKRSNKY